MNFYIYYYIYKIIPNTSYLIPKMSNVTTEPKQPTYTDRICEYMEQTNPGAKWVKTAVQSIREFSQKEYEARMANGDKMPFGKYKGKTVKSVFEFDKGYLEWLVKQDILQNYEQLKANIQTVLA
jgi:uncharacterized protein (DUF3820 family)